MRQLTKEEYEFLQPYSDRLNTASKSQYIRALPSNFVHQMRLIYERLIDKSYSMNESCGNCILTLCRKMKPYYDEYEHRSNREESENDDNSADAGRGTN